MVSRGIPDRGHDFIFLLMDECDVVGVQAYCIVPRRTDTELRRQMFPSEVRFCQTCMSFCFSSLILYGAFFTITIR